MSVYLSPTYDPTQDSFLSRASTKTYFDEFGVLQTAAINEAAYDHQFVGGQWVSTGLSVEGAATNLVTYSEQFDNAFWVKTGSTVAANSISAPDGLTTADFLRESASLSLHMVTVPSIATAGATTLSVYAKAGTRSYVALGFEGLGSPGNDNASFDLNTGTVNTVQSNATASITNVGGGWYRCSVTATLTNLSDIVILVSLDGSPVPTYTGDGVSGIYIWGAQLEAGSSATSYIQTTTATATRAADVLYGATYPLNHARIGYQNFVPGATLTPSTEGVGFEADSIQNQLTYEYWRPTAMPADVVIDMGSAQTFNYVGMAAHTLGSDSVSVAASYSADNITYTSIDATAAPSNDGAIMLLFTPISARYIKLAFTGASVFSLGVVYVGATLDMYRPFYAGHTPDSMGRRTVVKPTKSVGGQWLGRSIIRQGFTNSYAWKNIPVDWYRTNVDPFAVSAQKYPFFIAWNIAEEPEDALYAWVSKDIMPSLSGTRDLVEFGFDVEGLGDE